MDQTDLERIRAYHQATKHHPGRYARSLGYLDWATQPDPFRRFVGAELTRLPVPDRAEGPAYDALFEAGAVAPKPLNLESVSKFFYLSLAVSAWKQSGGSRWALRCNPSSGNLHPTESYAVLPALPGLPGAGVYHYAPREHGLEHRCAWDARVATGFFEHLPAGAFVAGLSSILWREAWKYGERAFRYCQHDVGHALGAMRLAAASLGWNMVVLAEWSDEDVARLLGLDRAADVEDVEIEEPELVVLVLPAAESMPRSEVVSLGPDLSWIAASTGVQWQGRAGRLSSAHVEWPIIDAAAQASRKPRGWPEERRSRRAAAEGDTSIAPRPAPARIGLSAFDVIRRRRSAVDFDGQTSITTATFYHMMVRVMPEALAPWDAISWWPRLDLLLFVHRVAGLAPGIYLLMREASRLERLRAAMSCSLAWERPSFCPPGFPLYALVEGDARGLAARLSLGQAIAGDSAFSLGMLADFDAALTSFGAWFYRRLFWEAGLIGQVLYLEAEAAGIRATGIGAYFDDAVRDLVGLGGSGFESLYHFTVGGPVEDARITTLPAYGGA